MTTGMQYVYTHRDGNAICDIADEVDRIYGFGITMVMVGSMASRTQSTLYIDRRFPTWEQAETYARELVDAAQVGRTAYQNAIRA